MAIETLDFLVSPNDDWTLVATNPDYLFIQPSIANPWRLAVTASGAPADPVAATGTITLGGAGTDQDTVTIGSTTFTLIDAPVQATGTFTFTAVGTAADTFDVGTVTFTLVTGAPATATEVQIGATLTETRDNALAAIQANSPSVGAPVVATSVSTDEILITADSSLVGAAGNAIVLTEASTAMTVTGSGTLTGGVDGTGTGTNGLPIGPTEVTIGVSITATRDELLTNIPLAIPPGLTVNAVSSSTDAIDLTAVVPGLSGNAIVLTETGATFTVTGSGTLTGGSSGTGSVVFKPEEYGGRGYAYESFAPITGEFYIKADRPRALLGQNVQFGVIRDNGAGSSGGGTSPSRVLVEPLGQPSVARQLTAGAASANTALTATVRRISMRAIDADIRYSIGTTAQTADGNTSHFIAEDERLDVAVPLGANIAVIRDGVTDGTLELSELI